MLRTPADSENPTGHTRREDGNQGLVTHEDGVSHPKDREESRTVVSERVAIKCDRVNPCSLCMKAGSQCTYGLGQRIKEKRQRVLISSVYESRMEHIANKVDELSEMMRSLSDERNHGSGCMISTRPGSPSHSLLPSCTRRCRKPSTDARGIESTMFAHVISMTKSLQAAVSNARHSNVAVEMASVMDDLKRTVDSQKEQNEALESACPFSKPLPPGLTFRDLPIPPIDRIMACLRIAQDHSPDQLYWPFELGSVGDFTQYVIRVFSPGSVSDAELIIVHYILYWLFTECSNTAGDDILKGDYRGQALVCKESLETILSNLSFHIKTNTDSILAMYLATIYCLQCGKPLTAGTFISRASLMVQSLGLHSKHALAAKPAGEIQLQLRLFWAVYVIEKTVSLRFGRPSTIRDHDITVPRVVLDRNMTSLLYNRLPDWIDVAIFSVREARTRALGAEFERIMLTRLELYKRQDKWSRHVIQPSLCRFVIHSNRAAEHSILACIYRGIPSENPSSMAPCPESIAAARAALKETEVCITILTDTESGSLTPDTWAQEVILVVPFMPFLILLSNIIETSDSSDLEYLRKFVNCLHSLEQSSRHSACIKRLRVLSALNDVAGKYVAAKRKREPGDGISALLTDLDMDTYLNGSWGSTNTESPGHAAPIAAELVYGTRFAKRAAG
ncbi:hypothetical protein BJX61DRAFT_535959 [Aspergillus egyptiacus]|nr:hypothetical protein BJX61DRAFT_535959 [Aspergillus egyptiacus]